MPTVPNMRAIFDGLPEVPGKPARRRASLTEARHAALAMLYRDSLERAACLRPVRTLGADR